MNVELSDRPLFDELLPLFRKMRPLDLQLSANWLITFVGNTALDEERERREVDARNDHDPVNTYERHPGVVTYRS